MTTSAIERTSFETGSPIGTLQFEPVDGRILRVKALADVTVHRVDYQAPNGTLHLRPEGWRVGNFERGHFRQWGGLNMWRRNAQGGYERASDAAVKSVKAAFEAAAADLTDEHPEAFEVGEARRRREVVDACVAIRHDLDAFSHLLDRIMLVAITGEPAEFAYREINVSRLSEVGVLYALGLELWRHAGGEGGYRAVVRHTFAPEPGSRWEQAR